MNEVLQHLRRAVFLPDGAGLTDGQLLEDYISRRDEAALAALVRRHGPMVWGVCRRILPNYHDAEDAFQATFLVLVRKATSIASRELLANWLYGVARQTALKARATAAKRCARERQVTEMPEPAAAEQDFWRDLQPVLDEELSHLPAKYRAVIVLCDLEGKTRKEAARQLGMPEGTVASRIATARRMLAKRLARHGLAVSGGALAAVLTEKVASAGVPDSVVSATIKAASLFAAGTAVTGAVSVKVVALTEGVLKSMFLAKLKITTAVLVAMALASGIGGGWFTALRARPTDRSTPVRTGQNKEKRTDKERPDLSKARFQPDLKTDQDKLQGTWKLVATHKHGKNVDPTDVPIHPHDLVIGASQVETKLSKGGGDRGQLELNPAASPKEITITWLIQWRGIYKLDEDKLTICFNPENGIRPDGFSTSADSGRVLFVYERVKRRPDAKDHETEKEGFTAWGKEVGGLQAGLGLRPGEKRAYHHGETLTLVVRVRNVGKETVKFQYLRQFLDENPPTVTDAEGKMVPQHKTTVLGFHSPVEVTLEPGKEIELESRLAGGARLAGAPGLRYELRPASGGGKPTTEEQPLFVGTGKVSLQYEQVLGNSSAGTIKLDPTLRKLGTGKLELEVKSDPHGAPGATEKPSVEDLGEAVKEEFKRLAGTWQLVNAPKAYEVFFIFSGRRCFLRHVMGDKDQTRSVEFTIAPAKSPKWVDAEGPDNRTWPGIYELQGDTLRMVFQSQPDGKRPTEFREGDGRIMNSYQRVKP